MKNDLIANAKLGVLGALGVTEGAENVVDRMTELALGQKESTG